MSISNLFEPNNLDLFCAKLHISDNISSPVSNEYLITSNLSIPNNTNTLLVYNSSVSSVPGLTYNAGTFTCTQAGMYSFCATALFDLNATGIRTLWFQNSSSSRITNSSMGTASNDPLGLQNSLSIYLNIGNTLQVFVFQNSGGNLNLLGQTVSSICYTRIIVSRLF